MAPRTIACAAIGFVLPIAVSFFLVRELYDFRSDPEPPASEDAQIYVGDELDSDGQSAIIYRAVPAQGKSLDPIPAKNFLLSVQFKLDTLPEVGRRYRLVYKYQGKKKPYPGWAVALHRLPTSFRPTVYWKDSVGTGGWYSFEEYEFQANRWYSMTLIASSGDSLRLFIEDKASLQGPKFAGGHDVAAIKEPASQADLYLGQRAHSLRGFDGEVTALLLAHLPAFPSNRLQAASVIDGGPHELKKRLAEQEVELWLNGEQS